MNIPQGLLIAILVLCVAVVWPNVLNLIEGAQRHMRGQQERPPVPIQPLEFPSAQSLSLTLLQQDALRLSSDLLLFLKSLGPEPPPMYTAKEIAEMPQAQSKALIDTEDGDYAEVCEYHSRDGAWFFPRTWQSTDGIQKEMISRWKRLLPWYDKVAASYALEMRDKVDTLRNRLVVEGFNDEALSLPIEGRDGMKNIRAISAAFWNLAYRAGEQP